MVPFVCSLVFLCHVVNIVMPCLEIFWLDKGNGENAYLRRQTPEMGRPQIAQEWKKDQLLDGDLLILLFVITHMCVYHI